MRKTKQKAFTLIELLVVISIIGLLASVVLVSLNSARGKARDAKRRSDMRNLATAMELYFNDFGYYPVCASQPICASTTGGYTSLSLLELAPTYVSRMPTDPTNVATQYGYYYARGYKKTSTSYASTGLTTDYIFGTRLENPAVGDPNYYSTAFGGWDNLSINYLIGN